MKYIALNPLSLLETLTKLAPDSSKTTLRSWIKEGRVAIDGAVATDGSMLVDAGQILSVGAKKSFIGGGIQILFEDPHIVVIDKPSGLLSVATAAEADKTAHSFLKDRYNNVYPVHRLDKDTSGVMVFARSEKACHQLNIMFEKHDMKRCYSGVLEGRLEPASGTWQSYLYEDEQYRVHSSPHPGKGVLAKTHFEVETTSNRFSLVQFTLETGKKNQIRVHCQEASHPIAGDKKYGACSDPIKRLCLHAHLLSFLHPVTQKPLSFTSPPPKEFTMILQRY
jgi:23S rRNA pseudouridine1911/1915/1917 synthase